MIRPGQRLAEAAPPPPHLRRRWVLLWDGDCGLCRRSVAWTQRRLPEGRVVALPYQQALDWLPPPVRDASPRQAHLRAPDGRYWGGGDVAAELLALAGHGRWAALLRRAPLRQALRWGYRLVARHRGLLGRWV